MFAPRVVFLLLLTQAGADGITPDWNILTDFATQYHFDMKNLVAEHLAGPLPYTEGSETGTIKFSLQKERLEIRSHGSAVLKEDVPDLPPPLEGANVQGRDELVFDGPAGFVAIKAKGSLSKTYFPGRLEYCVKVHFPQGLLPPGQMLVQQLDMQKPMIEQQLKSVPHRDMQIDGEEVSIIDVPGDHPVYIGLRQNAAPFGAGITPPSGGEWDPILKFTSWEHWAGSVEDFTCADMPEASTSASELLADPEARKTLMVFDELLSNLHGAQTLTKAFAVVPARPSSIFHDAAVNEVGTAAEALNKSQQQWPFVALAGAAGAFGGVVMLFALKRMGGKPSQSEPLLG